MTPQETKFVVEILKAGIVWQALLSDFERRFVNETAARYAQFGSKLSVKGKQWKSFQEIADKLNLTLPFPMPESTFKFSSLE